MRIRLVNNLYRDTISRIQEVVRTYSDIFEVLDTLSVVLDVTIHKAKTGKVAMLAYAMKNGIYMDYNKEIESQILLVMKGNEDIYYMFLFLHEYAHYKLHFETKSMNLLVREKEIEADAYACMVLNTLYPDRKHLGEYMKNRNSKHKELVKLGTNGLGIYKL